MSGVLTINDFQILFMSKLYKLEEGIIEKIQEDFDTIPEEELSVKSVIIKWPKVQLSINRKEIYFYAADNGLICGREAYIFTGNIWENYETDGPKELVIPMPEETYGCLHNYCFPINVLLKDYNKLVGARNWLKGLNVKTKKTYFTIEYIF